MDFSILDFLPDAPHTAFVLPCGGYDTMHDFLLGLSELLDFPAYFWLGNRWDALNDCLQDLRWIPVESIVIHFDGFFAMAHRLSAEEQSEAEQFLETLQFVAGHCHLAQPVHKRLRFLIH